MKKSDNKTEVDQSFSPSMLEALVCPVTHSLLEYNMESSQTEGSSETESLSLTQDPSYVPDSQESSTRSSLSRSSQVTSPQ